MRTREEARRARGYATPFDVDLLGAHDEDALLATLASADAVERTAAVRLLALSGNDHSETLLQMLAKEKSLYTRLEICAALEAGDAACADRMIAYLACIGTNQHQSVPKNVSRKRTYPLPRDLIARALGHMSPDILPQLLDVLHYSSPRQVSEVLDAIGFMVYHHPPLATHANYMRVIAAMCAFASYPVIFWKCLRCLSAFPLDACRECLTAYLAAENDPRLLAEAARSLAMIGQIKT